MIKIDGTGMNTAPGRINYLRKMLRGTSLGEFDKLAVVGSLTDNYLKHITEGLLEYPPPRNSLYKQDRVMRRAMHKPCNMLFNNFTAPLTGINNFPPLLSRSDAANKMPPEELNEIILNTVLYGWAKHIYLQGWELMMKTFREI